MRIDNLSKLGRLFWLNIIKLLINNIKIFNHIINTVSLLGYSHINLHSLVKMGNGDCSVFVEPQSAERLVLVAQEGKTVNIRSTN